MSYIYLFIVFFWAFHILQRVLFSLYIWQLKEYRIDRFEEELSRNRKILFPNIVLISFLFLMVTMFDPVGEWFLNALFILYFFLGLRAIYQLMKNGWRFPVTTKKMLVLVGLSFLVSGAFFYFLSHIFPRSIIIYEILMPVLLFFVVLVVQIPTSLFKTLIFKRARNKRNIFRSLKVIGITGSYGKSSTKEFIYTLLSEKYNVLKTEGNNNTEIGIANTILRKLNGDHQVFVCEMGAYKRGEIKRACGIAVPQIGVLTGINQQHLSLFGSQENIIKGKYELIESLPPDGIAFFNAKNEHCRRLYEQTKITKELYGDSASYLGEENILGAIAIAKYFGLTEGEISKGLEKIKDKIGGLKTREGIDGLIVLDANYSANLNGILAHLEYIKKIPGKKIMIMPSLIELGKDSCKVHEEIGESSRGICDLIITTEDFYQSVRAGNPEALLLKNTDDILSRIKEMLGPGDIVILESRVPEKLKKVLIK
jgi:UDP-N-acetylmuramoyl-tripeptide--D-alanyl-D-alanine ligase